MNIPIECKFDDFGLLYIDNIDYNKKVFFPRNNLKINTNFFKMNYTNDYIIKYQDNLQNDKIINMLLKFRNIKSNNIDFPIGYYKEFDLIKGQIIPYYKNGYSISYLNYLDNLESLSKYYYKSINIKENIKLLLLDILNLLEEMIDNNIIYKDVNPGNFIISNNKVYVIDFDIKYLDFSMNNKSFSEMLNNYLILLKEIYYNVGIEFNYLDKLSFNKIKKYIKDK